MADVYGTTGNDTLYGSNTEADNIFGFGGNDTLYGFGGNDNIYAGGGHDWLFGGNGDDYLVGATGWDVMYGGAGADYFTFASDTFLFADHDYIGDWSSDYINFVSAQTFYDYGVYDDNGDQVYDGVRIFASAADDGTADATIDLVGVSIGVFSSSWILGGTPAELA